MLNQEIEHEVMQPILADLQSGVLLQELDDATLKIMLQEIWEMQDQYKRMGVIIGIS